MRLVPNPVRCNLASPGNVLHGHELAVARSHLLPGNLVGFVARVDVDIEIQPVWLEFFNLF